jgi:hypothetical protein
MGFSLNCLWGETDTNHDRGRKFGFKLVSNNGGLANNSISVPGAITAKYSGCFHPNEAFLFPNRNVTQRNSFAIFLND